MGLRTNAFDIILKMAKNGAQGLLVFNLYSSGFPQRRDEHIDLE